MQDSETYMELTCRGVVSHESSCPLPFVNYTQIEGNLFVRADTNHGGGGNLHLEGPCTDGGCRKSGLHSATLDGDGVSIKAAGIVSIDASNSNIGNGEGSNLSIRSGNGTNLIGGAGGDILLKAGDGAGGMWLCAFFLSLLSPILLSPISHV